MLDQDLFNFVCTQLIKQGKPSTFEGMCAYRGEGGTKCAAGHVLPDTAYHPDLEGRSASNIAFAFPNDLNLNLLQHLQRAHDNAADRPDWLDEFKVRALNVAETFELDTGVLADA